MNEKIKTILDIVVVLASMNYWFCGYHEAGIILCAAYAMIRFIRISEELKIELLFFAMIQFTSFCIVSVLMIKELMQSSFLILYLLSSIVESAGLFCGDKSFYKKLGKKVVTTLLVFIVSILIIPSEMISSIGYSLFDTMGKNELIVLGLITACPYLISFVVQYINGPVKTLRKV